MIELKNKINEEKMMKRLYTKGILYLNDCKRNPNFEEMGSRYQIEHRPSGVRRGYRTRAIARLVYHILKKKDLKQNIEQNFDEALEEVIISLEKKTLVNAKKSKK